MRYRTRSIVWHGETFRFQYLKPSDGKPDEPLWAVSRRGEFIGVMPCPTEVTTRDFDMRSAHWLWELLGRQQK
jgi:hypothetical protein